MGLQNSNIIICKDIKLDKSYKDVLDYTEQEMVDLCMEHAVRVANNYSFIRSEKNVIKTSFSYEDALKCNYLAFQNPDYSNKWFFAFIDEVIYANDGTSRIRYTIDEFSTWFDYWNPEPCFVVREHVRDDTIGVHTIPEGLESGEYIINSCGSISSKLDTTILWCIGVSYVPSNTPFYTANRVYGGVYSGVTYFLFKLTESASNFIQAYASMGRLNDIVNIWTIPLAIANVSYVDGWSTGTLEGLSITFRVLPNSAGVTTIESAVNIASPTDIDGYTPKNNKLFTYPYNALTIANKSGCQVEYRYEDFIDNSPSFSVIAVPSPSCSGWVYPINYKKNNTTGAGYDWGLPIAKYPMGSWNGDQYTNWMTQNGINILGHRFDAVQTQQIGGMLEALAGGFTIEQGVGGIGSGLGKLFSSVQTQYKASMIPNSIGGQVNSGDITFASGNMSPTYYKMTIKSEYARIIDDWFSRFGYKINRVKLPDQTSRVYWNFVQIGASENIGFSSNPTRSVPASSMDLINSIYRAGTTIWHQHNNIGNYNLNNIIDV